MRFHDLRHTCATLLLAKGMHPKIVQTTYWTVAAKRWRYDHLGSCRLGKAGDTGGPRPPSARADERPAERWPKVVETAGASLPTPRRLTRPNRPLKRH